MKPFKRGFVDKCAEYGIDKEAAKEIFKKIKKNLAAHEAGESPAKEQKEEMCAKTAGAMDAIGKLVSQYQPHLIGAGSGALLGGLAGHALSDEKNKGRNTGLGALTGGVAGLGAGAYLWPEVQALINKINMSGKSEMPGLRTPETPAVTHQDTGIPGYQTHRVKGDPTDVLNDVKMDLSKAGPTSDMEVKRLAAELAKVKQQGAHDRAVLNVVKTPVPEAKGMGQTTGEQVGKQVKNLGDAWDKLTTTSPDK